MMLALLHVAMQTAACWQAGWLASEVADVVEGPVRGVW